MDTPTILKFSHYSPTCLWRWNRESVPKRQRIKFRWQGITQKKTYNSLTYVSGCIHFPWKWTWGMLAHHGDSPDHTGMWTCAPRWEGWPVCWVGGDVTEHAIHSNNHYQWWQHLYQVVRLNYGGSHSVCLCCLAIETSFICWLSLYNFN